MKALVGESVPSDETVLSDDVVISLGDVAAVPGIGVGDGADGEELLADDNTEKICSEDTKLLCAGNELLEDKD